MVNILGDGNLGDKIAEITRFANYLPVLNKRQIAEILAVFQN
jgi:hypothetical protein